MSAVYRAEEKDERAEDRSSLPEPIFYGGTLPTSLECPCRDLSRAHCRIYLHIPRRSIIHARYTGIHSLLEKSLEEWSISYECIPCKCAVDHGERRRLGREREGRTVGTVVLSSADRLSSGRWWGIGEGESSARRCGDNWVNTFRPFVPRIYIFHQGPRALCTRALGMRPHTCMRSGEGEVGVAEPRVRALGRTNFVADGWLYGKPAFREFKPVRRIRSFFF